MDNIDNLEQYKFLDDVLIYDIETDSLDIEKAKVKFIGCYSYPENKNYFFNPENLKDFQKLIDKHRIIVGFNNSEFDDVIIRNNGFKLKNKVNFDCLKVLFDFKKFRPNREIMIKTNDGKSLNEVIENRTLDNICKALFPDMKDKKGDIDYNIFKKDQFTDVEKGKIRIYVMNDIILTKKLFEFYMFYFDNFREFVNEDNARNLNYIRSSIGSYAYSVICHMCGINELYEDDKEKLKEKPINHGGYVLEPANELYEEKVINFDFTSLYPHIMFQSNIFSPVDKESSDKVNTSIFKTLQTSYNGKKMGKIEETIKDLFMKRLLFKKNKDKRELPLKYMLNSLYGLAGSPKFKSLYHPTLTGDVTRIGRICIYYVEKTFNNNGMQVLYGDTDSVFIRVGNKTMEEITRVKDKIIKDLKLQFPFPSNTFNLEIGDIYKKIYFHKKKMYYGITEDDKIIIKGLPIIKNNSTKLSKKILKKLKYDMIDKNIIKFDKEYIQKLVKEYLSEDITLASQDYTVKNIESYKVKTSIQYQIAKEYGAGKISLIPNRKIGEIGKIKRYCDLSMAKYLNAEDLILDKLYNELEPFEYQEYKTNLKDFI